MAISARNALIGLGVIGAVVGIGCALRPRPKRMLGSTDMLKVIAKEARSPEEFARRADAWNAAEAKPLPISRLAAAWIRQRGGAKLKIARLIREAEGARAEAKERLWTRMSKGLRGSHTYAGRRFDVVKVEGRRKWYWRVDGKDVEDWHNSPREAADAAREWIREHS